MGPVELLSGADARLVGLVSTLTASDLDLLYDYDPSGAFSLFDQAGAMLDLSDGLGVRVDLVSRIGLRPRLRHRIESEMVRVF